MSGSAAQHPARGRRGFHDLLTNVDRRVIFVAVALAVALPLLFPLNLPVGVSREALAYYDAMELLQPGDVIIFSFDYEPDTMAELDPMSYTTLRHAFAKDVRVLAQTTYAGGAGIAVRVLEEVAERVRQSIELGRALKRPNTSCTCHQNGLGLGHPAGDRASRSDDVSKSLQTNVPRFRRSRFASLPRDRIHAE